MNKTVDLYGTFVLTFCLCCHVSVGCEISFFPKFSESNIIFLNLRPLAGLGDNSRIILYRFW
ncbi:hypothetical protein CCUS01_10116 [Colletotrichum cuscutae]|uniref:Uncharacterized protein n=1 Tax=Colletotrichum cuscutae TaxID=1209917 RepID=A0AAI9XQC7_9PEZI|nr:hypothetical protein CCUS01_10116 [Colletotrichum cuscutae]